MQVINVKWSNRPAVSIVFQLICPDMVPRVPSKQAVLSYRSFQITKSLSALIDCMPNLPKFEMDTRFSGSL